MGESVTMGDDAPLPFIANMARSGAVSEVVSLDTPCSPGDSWFEWTIQKPGRIYEVRVLATDPSKNQNIWVTGLQVKGHPMPVPNKLGYNFFSWPNGQWVMPRDLIKIWFLSPIGIAVRGELVLDWYAD